MIDFLKLIKTGYCIHSEKSIIKTGRKEKIKIPAYFVLLHTAKHGYILYDTGYSPRFYTETQAYPLHIYALITPVFIKEEETAVFQLKQMGIAPEEIKYIIISHFHADHIGGLKDFPNAQFICSQKTFHKIIYKKSFQAFGENPPPRHSVLTIRRNLNAYGYQKLLLHLQQWGAYVGWLKQGFLPGLIPNDFEKRCSFIEDTKQVDISQDLSPFKIGYDLFGDGSITAVFLPGHAHGQIGIYAHHQDQPYFFIADACWTKASYQQNIPPSMGAFMIFDHTIDYLATLKNLHLLHKYKPEIHIIPLHGDNRGAT